MSLTPSTPVLTDPSRNSRGTPASTSTRPARSAPTPAQTSSTSRHRSDTHRSPAATDKSPACAPPEYASQHQHHRHRQAHQEYQALDHQSPSSIHHHHQAMKKDQRHAKCTASPTRATIFVGQHPPQIFSCFLILSQGVRTGPCAQPAGLRHPPSCDAARTLACGVTVRRACGHACATRRGARTMRMVRPCRDTRGHVASPVRPETGLFAKCRKKKC